MIAWLARTGLFIAAILSPLPTTAATLLASGTSTVASGGNLFFGPHSVYLDFTDYLTSPPPPWYPPTVILSNPPAGNFLQETGGTYTLRVITPSAPTAAYFSNEVSYSSDDYIDFGGGLVKSGGSDNAGVLPCACFTPVITGNVSSITFNALSRYYYNIQVDDVFGNGGSIGYSVPAWVLFGADLPEADLGKQFSFQLFAGTIPEPSTWAMMILGFGLCGAMLRRRRSAPVI